MRPSLTRSGSALAAVTFAMLILTAIIVAISDTSVSTLQNHVRRADNVQLMRAAESGCCVATRWLYGQWTEGSGYLAFSHRGVPIESIVGGDGKISGLKVVAYIDKLADDVFRVTSTASTGDDMAFNSATDDANRFQRHQVEIVLKAIPVPPITQNYDKQFFVRGMFAIDSYTSTLDTHSWNSGVDGNGTFQYPKDGLKGCTCPPSCICGPKPVGDDTRSYANACATCKSLGCTCNGDLGSAGTVTGVAHGDVSSNVSNMETNFDYDALKAGRNPMKTTLGAVNGALPALSAANSPYHAISARVTAPISVSGRVELFVDGVLDFSDLQVTYTPWEGSELIIYQGSGGTPASTKINGNGAFGAILPGSVEKDGQTITSMTASPQKLQLYVDHTAEMEITLNGTADFCGVIFAAGTTAKLNGNGNFYGAVVVNDFIKAGGAFTFHYDDALGSLVPRFKPEVIIIPQPPRLVRQGWRDTALGINWVPTHPADDQGCGWPGHPRTP